MTLQGSVIKRTVFQRRKEMQNEWVKDDGRNLLSALHIIDDLLNSTELNMDDMEEETRNSIENAYGFLSKAHADGRFKDR